VRSTQRRLEASKPFQDLLKDRGRARKPVSRCLNASVCNNVAYGVRNSMQTVH
jgi:hypothetical protein